MKNEFLLAKLGLLELEVSIRGQQDRRLALFGGGLFRRLCRRRILALNKFPHRRLLGGRFGRRPANALLVAEVVSEAGVLAVPAERGVGGGVHID